MLLKNPFNSTFSKFCEVFCIILIPSAQLLTESYTEIRTSDYSDEVKIEELMKLLNERHRLIRRISHITPKKSTYDKASDLLKSDIDLLKQASAIIDKAVEDVMGLNLDSMSQEDIDFSTPIDVRDNPEAYEIF